ERNEVLILGDEVGLGVDLDDRGAVALRREGNAALGGDAVGLLVGLGQARLAQRLGGGVDVAAGLGEGLLALHHAGAGALAQFLDHGSGDFHCYLNKSVGMRAARGSLGRFGLAFGGLGLRLVSLGVVGLGRAGVGLGLVRLGVVSLGLAGLRLLARGAAALAVAFAALGELFLAHGRGAGRRGLALEHGLGGGARVPLHGADGVVVARDRVVDQGRVVVGVDDGDDRDAELLGFLDRDVLVADVDHEQRVGQAAHFLDAAQRGQQLVALTAQAQHFVLDQLLEGAVGLGGLQLLEAADRLLHGGEVGQRAAQPALGHVRHAATLGFFLH